MKLALSMLGNIMWLAFILACISAIYHFCNNYWGYFAEKDFMMGVIIVSAFGLMTVIQISEFLKSLIRTFNLLPG